jgi:predicted flap endonuclease-1-like 5' DNA nuclease
MNPADAIRATSSAGSPGPSAIGNTHARRDEWRLQVMTSTLAAALRELDRSRAALEAELADNSDYVAWRRLESASSRLTGALSPLGGPSAQDAARDQRALLKRLQTLPIFNALQAIESSRHLIHGGDAVLAEEQLARLTTPPRGAHPINRADFPAATAAPAPPPRFEPAPGPLQPLDAIRGMTPDIARKLRVMGITRYQQIAAWRAADVRAVAAFLNLGRSINQQNWIEQPFSLCAMAPGTTCSDRRRLSRSNPNPRSSPQHKPHGFQPRSDRPRLFCLVLSSQPIPPPCWLRQRLPQPRPALAKARFWTIGALSVRRNCQSSKDSSHNPGRLWRCRWTYRPLSAPCGARCRGQCWRPRCSL